KVLAMGLALVAVVSPLYVDYHNTRRISSSYVPLLLVVAISVSEYLKREISRFDTNWIHRVGGSSAGLAILLILLTFVLKCR
ncbi:hypothetical protein M569_08436, partial [Genlisea aurea]